jgi:hypothetical protein
MRWMVPALVIAAVAAPGCGGNEEAHEAERVAADFFTALERRDGEAACAVLSTTTRETLRRDERSPCPEAIKTLGLSGGAVREADVYVTQARVTLAGGDAVFLGRTPAGWRVDAAGCSTPPTKDEPFDCELES